MTTNNVKRVGIMWDTETLGLGPKAVVTQLTFVSFDLDDPDTKMREVEEFLPIQPQVTLGREVSASTILWWMRQPDEARAMFQKNDGEDFDELLALVNSVNRKLSQELDGAVEYEIWARGVSFDMPIIESLFNDVGQKPAYRYDRVFDLRTLMRDAKIGKADVPMRAGLIPHHALSDCLYQIDCLVEATRRMHARI